MYDPNSNSNPEQDFNPYLMNVSVPDYSTEEIISSRESLNSSKQQNLASCTVCSKQMQIRSLKRHLKQIHRIEVIMHDFFFSY